MSAHSAPPFPARPLANPPVVLQQPHRLQTEQHPRYPSLINEQESCTRAGRRSGQCLYKVDLDIKCLLRPGVCQRTDFTVCAFPRTDTVPFGEGDIGTMCLHLSMKPGEYSYFSPRTLSMWAGPEHWRFKPRHKSMCLETTARTVHMQLLPGPAYLWRWVTPESK